MTAILSIMTDLLCLYNILLTCLIITQTCLLIVSRQPLEGQLYKYTNVMKGWQYRWFVLEPNKGRLDYYEVTSANLTC